MNFEDNDGEMIIYTGDDGRPRIEVTFQGETAWLTQAQLVDLFQSSKANISEHIRNIYDEGELSQTATVRKFRTVRIEGDREVVREIEHYNLDMIISLGYRIKSKVATQFRIWATERLREYIIKGFAMNDKQLKQTGGGVYWKELLERIRDIRSSEKIFYRQVLDLFATSTDYDPKFDDQRKFFQIVQNKLHYAVNQPTKDEAVIAKNYLSADEIAMLNRLVSAFFDLAELKAINHEPMRMQDWVAEVDIFASVYGKGVLDNAGTISHSRMIEKVTREYETYKKKTRNDLSDIETTYLAELKQAQKKLEKNK
jgi:hypothetical protein